MSLFARVRDSCAAVARRARQVRIVEEGLDAYATELARRLSASPPAEVDPAAHYLGHGRDTLAFFFLLDAVNFGSGYFPQLRKKPGLSGYFTVARSLREWVERHGVPAPQTLVTFNEAECAELFQQDLRDPAVEKLMSLFASAWNALGEWLLRRFEGRWEGPVETAAGSALRLARLLIEMPYFDDVARYAELEVAFYKRAQITAADLHYAFQGEGWGAFEDLDRLTIFADNLVPHVLRVDGVLRYHESLARRIDAGLELPAGSLEEVEIRACAVHAVEHLVDAIRAAGRPANAMRLDYLLWNRGQMPAYKARPRHRTRTVYY